MLICSAQLCHTKQGFINDGVQSSLMQLGEIKDKDTSRDLLLHSCWHLPLCQYFFSYITRIFTPWSGLWEVTLSVRAIAGNVPPLKKWGFASNCTARTLLAHCFAIKDGAVFTQYYLPQYFTNPWILVIPPRPFSANLRNTGHPLAPQFIRETNISLTSQKKLKHKQLTLGSWCTALILSRGTTDAWAISPVLW